MRIEIRALPFLGLSGDAEFSIRKRMLRSGLRSRAKVALPEASTVPPIDDEGTYRAMLIGGSDVFETKGKKDAFEL